MSKIAFELRANVDDFTGGTTSLPDGETFDVGEALKSGSGKIILNPVPGERKNSDSQEQENQRAKRDETVVNALDSYPALKRAAVSGSGDSSTTSDGGKG